MKELREKLHQAISQELDKVVCFEQRKLMRVNVKCVN